eukprot:786750-Amphidinium_carterae.2
MCVQLGHDSVELRCDGEPATVALQEKVQATRLKGGLRTVLSTTKLVTKGRDSQSNGLAESSIRWWRAKVRTLRYDVLGKFGVELNPSMSVWPWLVELAALAPEVARPVVE